MQSQLYPQSLRLVCLITMSSFNPLFFYYYYYFLFHISTLLINVQQHNTNKPCHTASNNFQWVTTTNFKMSRVPALELHPLLTASVSRSVQHKADAESERDTVTVRGPSQGKRNNFGERSLLLNARVDNCSPR